MYFGYVCALLPSPKHVQVFAVHEKRGVKLKVRTLQNLGATALLPHLGLVRTRDAAVDTLSVG